MIFDGIVLFSQDGGRVYAQRTIDALWKLIRQLGEDISANTEVLSVTINGETAIVETEFTTFRTPSVVIAAGAWLPRLIGEQVTDLAMGGKQPVKEWQFLS
jgi:glycine/D-amino acid oxidase-like deaminating enzyme